MTKTKILIGLATLTCAISITTPANAWFQASTKGGPTQATKGPIDEMPTEAKFVIRVAGVPLATALCKKTATSKATGFWNIETSEEVVFTKGTKIQTQAGTKKGPHESITITNWGACTVEIGGAVVLARVSACRLQVRQPGLSKAEQEAFGSVQTDCVIEGLTTSCIIIVDQQLANHNLKTVILSPAEQGGVLIKANVVNITYKTTGVGCGIAGLPAEGSEAEFKTDDGAVKGIQTSLQKLV